MAKRPDDICEIYCFDREQVSKAKKSLPGKNESIQISQKLKILSDPTRLRIIYALQKTKELCVCDLANALEMNISAVSHQLRMLRAHNLVKYRKDGKMAFYSLIDSKSEVFRWLSKQ